MAVADHYEKEMLGWQRGEEEEGGERR